MNISTSISGNHDYDVEEIRDGEGRSIFSCRLSLFRMNIYKIKWSRSHKAQDACLIERRWFAADSMMGVTAGYHNKKML
jgi:hypothetical protein